MHCPAAGRFFSDKNTPETEDFRCMYQITSSAIANIPPPNVAIKLVNQSGKMKRHLNRETKEEMFRLFKSDVDGKKLGRRGKGKVTIPRRNYCTVSSDIDGGLLFSINVECVTRGSTTPYTVKVPPLRA